MLAGKAKATLKGAATSVLQQLHKHAVASADGGDVQRWATQDESIRLCSTPVTSVCLSHRVIYDTSMKTLNDILDL